MLLLLVALLLTLAVGFRITDSALVKLGLLGMAGFILQRVGAVSGGAEVSRLVVITVASLILIPIAVVLFLFAVCMFEENGISLTAPPPPIRSYKDH